MLTLYIADAERGVGMKNLSQKEAIALLRNLEDSLDSYCGLNEEGKTAFRMAIEALSCSEIPNNSDTISRRQAIRWVKQECNPYGKPTLDFESGKRVMEHLEMMPSAQPEPRTAYWTKDIVGSVVCSNCGGIREDNRIGHTQWCNCCGCFMRGE